MSALDHSFGKGVSDRGSASETSCDSSVVEHPLGKREVESSILSRSTIARFWAKVDGADRNACWQWTAALDRYGYGQFKTESLASPKRSHRVAWELTRGPIPDGSLVLHNCDNPRCCNPAHLRLGTHEENMADMRCRNRAWRGGPRRKQVTPVRAEPCVNVRHTAAHP